ncbi:unnamed protein product [Lymnaea stagnalis]|uniref:Centromere protein M n=1 Tax=Lymnaea stagnalis TaxID=6523 RepID=A0AAV2HLA8_LYMST
MEHSNSSSVSEDVTILRPHNTIRNLYGPRTALVIAHEHCLRIPDDLKTFTEGEHGVNVRYTKKLPLKNTNHPPIDAIVMVYKIGDKDSFNTIKQSLPLVDIKYLLSQCFILVVSDGDVFGGDLKEIENFSRLYHLPFHCAYRRKDPEGKGLQRLQIPSNLMSIYCPPAGSDVNPFVIAANLVRNEQAMASASQNITD